MEDQSEVSRGSATANKLHTVYSRLLGELEPVYKDVVEAAGRKAFDVLDYSQVLDPRPQDGRVNNKELINSFVREYFLAVLTLVVVRCHEQYKKCITNPAEEAKRKRFEVLILGADAKAQLFVTGTAQWIYRRWWLAHTDQAQATACNAAEAVNRFLGEEAFYTLAERNLLERSGIAWEETFRQAVEQRRKSAFEFFFVTCLDAKAKMVVQYLAPDAMDLDELGTWSGVAWLEAQAGDPGSYQNRRPKRLPAGVQGHEVLPTPSMSPAQLIDRAARGLGGWVFTDDAELEFFDPNTKSRIFYYQTELQTEIIKKVIEKMDESKRTADVWRLVSALALSQWSKGEAQPPAVQVDVRDLCTQMGYKPHKNRGHRPGNLAVAARGLRDLDRFHVELALGTTYFPINPQTGNRRREKVSKVEATRVLSITEIRTERIIDGECLPVECSVTLGGWTRNFPRNQFVPLFDLLIKFPTDVPSNIWAKALGVELLWQFRQDEGKRQKQHVKTMLEQAGVLQGVLKDKDKGRKRDLFESAMNILEEHAIFKHWMYSEHEPEKVPPRTGRWFKSWLDWFVWVEPTHEIAAIMQGIAEAKSTYKKVA